MRGLLLIAGVLAISQPAWAKYDPCGRGSVFEPAGRVPRNAKIWLWHGGGDGGERLRIRGPDLDRAISPPFAGSSRGLAAFDPGLLERDATYQIAIVFDRHAWTLAELATGSEVDHQPPLPPRFHALAITQLLDPSEPAEPTEPAAFEDVAGFAVPASDIATALELSDDTVALDVSFDDSAEHFLMPPEAPGLLGRDRCGPKRRFRVGARVCMSIRAIDLAGNRSDAATRCTTVGGRIGDTSRIVHAHTWAARHHSPWDEPYGWLALTSLAIWLGGLFIAVGRLVEAEADRYVVPPPLR